MRIGHAALWLAAVAVAAWGQPKSPAAFSPSFEVVKDHTNIEVAPDGSDISSRQEIYRALDARGIDALHERRIGFTQGYENVEVVAAYTLKANGQRIDVPKSSFLSGFGQTSQPGFQDSVVVSIFYPNLEVGDSVVLETVHRQIIPWFKGYFDFRGDYSRSVAAHDVQITLSAPSSMPLVFDQTGLDAAPPRLYGDRKRWMWTYRNDTPATPDNGAVAESDYGPHLVATSFKDYAEVAREYGARGRDAANVTPEIGALAEQLTQGVADKRAQAKILYDWVSSHIAYVDIVLGAGGFTPHTAKEVLANRFGDCKDHVVLLEALLNAKGIDSTAVLIRAGVAAYKLSPAATPHGFDHAITYLPAFDLYLDSTAQLAPFGVLPYSDAGKPVLKVATGEVAQTPTPTSQNSTVRAVGEVDLAADGSANATMRFTSTGAYGVAVRSFLRDVKAGEETKFLRDMVGPGVDGTLDRGDPMKLVEPYPAGATYRIPGAISIPGPGALAPELTFKPFSFTSLVGGDLPAARSSDYVCLSLAAEQETKFVFPPGFKLLSIPDPQVLTAEGVRLTTDWDRSDARTLKETIALRIDHPQATCTPEYYQRVRGTLEKMANKLREQIIYRGPREAQN